MLKRSQISVFTIFIFCLGISTFPAAAQTCEYYEGATSFPYHELGLGFDSSYSNIVTSGNHAYLFDLTHLDVCNLEDPDQIQHIEPQPPIVIDGPIRLRRIGDDRLYAYHTDGVSIIDISTRDTPILVTTIPSFGEGFYLGEWSEHGYYLSTGIYNDDAVLSIYSFVNPDAPELVTTWPVPLPPLEEGIGNRDFVFGRGHLYVLAEYPLEERYIQFTYNFWIFDLTDPTEPTLSAHFNPENAPADLEGIVLGYPRFQGIFEDTMYVSNKEGVVGIPELDGWTESFLLTDPDLPAKVPFTLDGPFDIVANGLPYAVYNSYPIFEYKLTFGPTTFTWTGESSRLALTDRAVVFTYDHPQWDNDHIVTAPRQCDPPVIVYDSLEHSLRLNLLTGGFDIEVTWRTEGWTDPQFDKLTLTDGRRNPPEAQIGTVVRTGGEHPVLQPDGTWLHKMSYSFQECVSLSSYNYEIQSERTGLTDSDTGLARIKLCPRQSPGGGGRM